MHIKLQKTDGLVSDARQCIGSIFSISCINYMNMETVYEVKHNVIFPGIAMSTSFFVVRFFELYSEFLNVYHGPRTQEWYRGFNISRRERIYIFLMIKELFIWMHILHEWIKFIEHFRSGENMEVVSTWKFIYKKDITNDWS